MLYYIYTKIYIYNKYIINKIKLYLIKDTLDVKIPSLLLILI